MERPHDWIRSHLAKHGREWTVTNFPKFRQETGSEMTAESFGRKVRFLARELAERVAPRVSTDTLYPPTQSPDVSTLTDSLEYHEVDEIRFSVQKLIHNTWGSYTNPNRQTKVFLKPREPEELSPEQIAEKFAEIVSTYKPPTIQTPARVTTGKTLELALPDLHLGRVIYGESTGGEDFGLEQARHLYLDAVAELTAGYPENAFDAILFPFGNDFFNVDNVHKTTTAGTPQPETEHPLRMWEVGFRVAVDAINAVLPLGDVHVPIIPGNHDQQTSFLIGLALEAWYKDQPGVTIDNSASPHKAYGRGSWGVVWHHGHKLKRHDLAMLFADCYPELWARTKYREVHQGHFHSVQNGEYRADSESHGVRVRTLPSLAPADEWTVNSGYRSLREAVAIIWDEERGIESQRFYHPRGAA